MGDNETNEILQRLTRVETKLDVIISDDARNIAQEALLGVKDAKSRLDKIERVIFWAGTTVIGGIILGTIGLLFKLKGA